MPFKWPNINDPERTGRYEAREKQARKSAQWCKNEQKMDRGNPSLSVFQGLWPCCFGSTSSVTLTKVDMLCVRPCRALWKSQRSYYDFDILYSYKTCQG